MSLVAASYSMRVRSWGTSAERARNMFYAAAMKGRTRVITCVNKSLVQALESCRSPHAPAVLPTLVRENSKSAGLVNAYMDS